MNSRLQQKDHQLLESRAYPGFLDAVLLLVLISVIVLFFGAVALGLFGPSMERSSIGSRSVAPSGEFIVWITVIGNTLAFGVAILVSKASAKRPWNELIPISRKIPYFPACLVPLGMIGLGLSVIFSEVDNFVRFFFPASDWFVKIMMEITSNGLASFVALVIVAPLTEEIFFRGVVLSGFLKRYSPAAAIVLSAILFSIIHLNLYQMIGAFGIGLIFAWMRIVSGSLWPSIYLHALTNGTAFFIAVIGLDIPGYSFGDGSHQFQPWWFDGIGIGLFSYGFILSVKLFNSQNKEDKKAIPP